MKYITLFTAILTASSAYGYEVNTEKIKAFVKKDGLCNIATYEVVREKKIRKRMGREPLYVNCIGDLTFNKGTIKEMVRCAAYSWNLETNNTSPLTQAGANTSAKSCAAGGVEDVLNDLLYRDENGKKILVRDRFEFQKPNSNFAREIVYSSKDSYRDLLHYPKTEIDLNQADIGK